MLTGLFLPERIGGVLGHSGFLFPFAEINNKDTPILICHGDEDERIPIDIAMRLYEPIKNRINLNIIKGLEHSMMQENFDIMK